MQTSRFTWIAVVAIAIGAAGSAFAQGGGMGGMPGMGAAPASAPAKTGTVTGKVVDKDGKPANAAAIVYLDPAAAASQPAAGGGGGGGGGRGGRGRGRGLGNATTNDKGEFTIKEVAVGKVTIQATLTAADGSRQRGTSDAVEVKEGADTKLTADIKLADLPARGGGGGGGGGGGRGAATRGGGGN